MQLFSNQRNQTTVDIDFALIVGILFGITVMIVALPLLIVGALIMRALESRGNASRTHDTPAENQQTQAEIDARASIEGWISLNPKVASSFNAAEYYVDNKG